MGSHARFLQLQGQNPEEVDLVGQADLENAKLPEKERALLDFVKVLTLEPAKTQDSHVERLRKVGYTDEQIFEASFITALFAFFNRMADAYGLDYPANGWMPPSIRESRGAAEPPPAPAPQAAPR
ncbi:MAG: carboxymuconolactone decarboxylase family protein [Armatimonadota bacterium]